MSQRRIALRRETSVRMRRSMHEARPRLVARLVSVGGRDPHELSGVAHYSLPDDESCLDKLRQLVGELPAGPPQEIRPVTPPRRSPYELYDLLPDDHRQPYDTHDVLDAILDGEGLDEFQPRHAREMICGTAFVEGIPVGVIATPGA